MYENSSLAPAGLSIPSAHFHNRANTTTTGTTPPCTNREIPLTASSINSRLASPSRLLCSVAKHADVLSHSLIKQACQIRIRSAEPLRNSRAAVSATLVEAGGCIVSSSNDHRPDTRWRLRRSATRGRHLASHCLGCPHRCRSVLSKTASDD